MELSETIDTINEQLVNLYGHTLEGQPIFRIVWSEDQFEKRLMGHTDSGIELLTPQVRTVPKYRQWIKERYVLERLVAVPEVNQSELPTVKMSYEPIWVFNDKFGNYIPPRIDAAKFIVDCLYAALGKKSLAKYKDEEALEEMADREGTKKRRTDKLMEELFGNETATTDALAYKTGVVVPQQGVNHEHE